MPAARAISVMLDSSAAHLLVSAQRAVDVALRRFTALALLLVQNVNFLVRHGGRDAVSATQE
jgi:hypothetical protein